MGQDKILWGGGEDPILRTCPTPLPSLKTTTTEEEEKKKKKNPSTPPLPPWFSIVDAGEGRKEKRSETSERKGKKKRKKSTVREMRMLLHY